MPLFLLSLFKGGGFFFKYWKYIAVLLLLAGVYFYHQSLIHTIQSKEQKIISLSEANATLEADKQTLTVEITEQNKSILLMENQQAEAQSQIIQLSIIAHDAKKEADTTKAKLLEHDIGNLALHKPKQIEKIINAGTKKVLQDIERLSDPTTIEKELKK